MFAVGLSAVNLLYLNGATENLIWLCSGLLVLFIGAYAWRLYTYICHLLGGSPTYLLEAIKAISQGKLQENIHLATEDSKSILAGIINMRNTLKSSVAELNSHSLEINACVQQISAQYNEISFASQMQGLFTSQTTESIAQIQERINTISGIVTETEQISHAVVSQSVSGASLLSESMRGMADIKDMIQLTTTRINRLQEGSKNIHTVINLIKGIADQTNLLALNAAIEAARAGDQGRGFAVVAEEVRKLADNTTKAAVDVSRMVNEVQDETHQVVISMQQVQPLIDSGVQSSEVAVDALNIIEQQAIETLQKINSISAAVQDEIINSAEIVDNLGQINDMLKTTDGAVSSAASTTVNLERAVSGLDTAIKQISD
jgi:methyl-accepting chemotaxis protein